MNINKNKVIIVGGDHHNGLGLARLLGIKGIEVTAIVVTKDKRSWISKSRYIKKSIIVNSDIEVIELLLKMKSEDSTKLLVIPYSDGAALELDEHLDALKDRYVLPSFNGESGKIKWFMDKYNQYSLFKGKNINVVNSISIKLNELDCIEPEKFPCIIKPSMSVYANKSDICICDDIDSYRNSIKQLREKKIKEVIVQDYLYVDYEVNVFGGIAKGEISSMFANRCYRRWPVKGGTSSFTQVLTDPKIYEYCEKILNVLADKGFCGLYDLDLFIDGNEIYLNEINFRNSGSGFRALGQGFNYVYLWIELMLNEWKFDGYLTPERQDYTMTEYTDFKNVLCHNVTLIEWIRDFNKCSSYAIIDGRDLSPLFYKIIYKVI